MFSNTFHISGRARAHQGFNSLHILKNIFKGGSISFSLFSLFALFVWMGFVSMPAAHAQGFAPKGLTQAALVTPAGAAAPGTTLEVALQLTMPPHWHTYYTDPGDAGLATTLVWESATINGQNVLPALGISDIHWPEPDTFVVEGLTSYGYEGTVLLISKLTMPTAEAFENLNINLNEGAFLELTARADWLECDEVCQPGSETLTLRIPLVADAGSIPPAAAALAAQFEAARATWEHVHPAEKNAAAAAGNHSATGTGNASELSGLGTLLLFGFIGGLILNLMPCVFPVIGLKIMGFVGQAGSSRAKMLAHGLAFTGGVLVSFLALAAVFLALRAGGEAIGWGFQLQNAGIVLGLVFLFLIMALNLSGLFEIGGSLMGAGQGLQHKEGASGSFFSGILATVVATPCSAPFLGTALGATIALPAPAALGIFTAIALGLAAPYLLFSLFPAAVKWLPRPGPWMETFKQLMAFLLYATVAYLVWVLAGLVDATRLLSVLMALVVLALACWLWGQYVRPEKSKRTRRLGMLVAAVLAALAIKMAYTQETQNWQAWSPELAAQLAAEGTPVFIDYTARWCVTCQANKKTTLEQAEVLAAFAKKNVALLRADWTARDPSITQALEALGKSAVPVYALHKGDGSSPTLLPEILTPGIVIKALEGLKGL